jgi:hypothetical protein
VCGRSLLLSLERWQERAQSDLGLRCNRRR